MTVKVKRDRLSGHEVICIDLDDSPVRTQPSAKRAKLYTEANADDDDVIILDAPPVPITQVRRELGSRLDDDEIALVGVANAMALPHARPDCPVKPFSKKHVSISLSWCTSCYCFVCDKPVSQCESWTAHCLAHKASSHWNTQRKLARKRRNSISSASNSTTSKTLESSNQQRLFQSQRTAAPAPPPAQTRPRQQPAPATISSLITHCGCELCRGLESWLPLKGLEIHARLEDGWSMSEISCLVQSARAQPEVNTFFTGEYGLRIVQKTPASKTSSYFRRCRSPGIFHHGSACTVCSAWISRSCCKTCGLPAKQLLNKKGVKLSAFVESTPSKKAHLLHAGTICAGYDLEWAPPSSQDDFKTIWSNHPEWQMPDLTNALKYAADAFACAKFRRPEGNHSQRCYVRHVAKQADSDGKIHIDNAYGLFAQEVTQLENYKKVQEIASMQISSLELTEESDSFDDFIFVEVSITVKKRKSVQAFRVSIKFEVYFTPLVFKPPSPIKNRFLGSCLDVLNLLGISPVIDRTTISWSAPGSAQSTLGDYEIKAAGPKRTSGGWASTAVDLKSLLTSMLAEKEKASISYRSIRAFIQDLENRGHKEFSQPDGLNVTLLPFQRQAVQWMLDQERLEGGINSHLFTQVSMKGQLYTFSPVLNYFRRDPLSQTRGGILATEMGLGKTIMSVSVILANPPPADMMQAAWGPSVPNKVLAKGTLVVCPVSLVGQWVQECEQKLAGDYRIYRYYGKDRTIDLDRLKEFDIVVTTYAVLASDKNGKNKGAEYSYRQFGAPPLERLNWWRILLDESHTIKAPGTLQSRSCIDLTSLRKWCVTGTPINSAFTDLSSQLNFLGVAHLGEAAFFDNCFCKAREAPYPIISFLRRIILRHSKDQLFVEKRGTPPPPPRKLLDLPPRRDNELIVDMDAQELAAYKALELSAQSAVKVIGTWSASRRATATFLLHSIIRPLRQAASSGLIASSIPTPTEKSTGVGGAAATRHIDMEDDPAALITTDSYSGVRMRSKLNALITKLEYIRKSDPNAKSLVFSQFNNTLNYLQTQLPQRNFQYRTLKGDMSMSARTRALREFQEDPPTTIFLISVRAAACGINLTQASHVFLMEPALNPALQDQAIGRVHRMGQQRCVYIHHVVMRNSIETRIRSLLYGSKDETEAPSLPKSSAPTSQPLQPLNDITSSAANADDLAKHNADTANDLPKSTAALDCLAGSLRADNAKLDYLKFAQLVGI